MAKARRQTAGELSPELVARIRADIERHRPGLWAEENGYGAACICGKALQKWHAEGGGVPNGRCERHAD